MNRLKSIDALRGFVMVIMLIDHIRETFYLHLQVSDPVDVFVTNPDLFYTRFVSSICAPVFIWLTGVSASYYFIPSAFRISLLSSKSRYSSISIK
jgi:uncharacterized membrane protein